MAVAEGLGGESGREARTAIEHTGLWMAAIFVNGIGFTLALSVVPQLLRTSDPKAFFPLAFCVAGVILAGAAIRASIRRKRFGQTYFEFASLPFSPGRTLKGTIHLRFDTDAQTWHRPESFLRAPSHHGRGEKSFHPARAFSGKLTRMCRRHRWPPDPWVML